MNGSAESVAREPVIRTTYNSTLRHTSTGRWGEVGGAGVKTGDSLRFFAKCDGDFVDLRLKRALRGRSLAHIAIVSCSSVAYNELASQVIDLNANEDVDTPLLIACCVSHRFLRVKSSSSACSQWPACFKRRPELQ